MDVTCVRCQAAVPEGSAFCSNCGRPMQTAGAATASLPAAGRPDRGGRQPAGGLGHRSRWYGRPAVMVTLAVVALLLTGLAGGAWYISTGFDALHQLSTPPPQISGDRLGGNEEVTIDTGAAQRQIEQAGGGNPALSNLPDGSVAVLLMGVDARPGEPIDVDVRPDSLAVVYLDGNTNACRMLSIPRDTRVELPGYGESKVNHALAVGGVPYEQLVVEHLLGIEIDHFGLVDFAGVTQLVDAVGGITITNGEAFTIESETTVFPFPVGSLDLNGEQALMYARYRGGPDGDFGRQARQQEVVRALLTKGAGLDIVTAVPELLSAVDGHIRTDMGAADIVRIGQKFRSGCTAETLETARLEGTIQNAWDDLLQLELSFVMVDEAEVRQKVAWLVGQEEFD
jgi:LCP family protein required for cell wall assembly